MKLSIDVECLSDGSFLVTEIPQKKGGIGDFFNKEENKCASFRSSADVANWLKKRLDAFGGL